MDAVLARIDELTPTEAAERLGVARSRLYKLRAGKQGVYSLERLISFGARLGPHTHLAMRKTA
ncbi:XRE family transcriptional regulator [Nocardia sp. NPDC050378]|uniref:XRE family transcriptional regulator n=1 Tax=Nocardia sp. NPDC050378 TaxID=3155400 RepID=UPI0033FFF3E9